MDIEKRQQVADVTIQSMLPLWMQNFARNVPSILGSECPHCHKKYDNCKDVRELMPMGGPAIIIGASPAIEKLEHLQKLANSNFKGTIIVTDRVLIRCLKAGIIPDFVCSVDGASEIATYYRHKLVEDNKDKIKAVMNSMIHPDTLREFKGEKYIFHSTLDADGPTSLTRSLHYMTHNTIIPGTGDVGGFCIHLAIALDFNPICLIGMSYAGYQLEDLADYLSYIRDCPKDKQDIPRFFWKHTHPLWGDCQTSMLWESCWDVLKERLEFFHNKKGVNFVNCTGMGLIHDVPGVECMNFEEFLLNERGGVR